MVRIEEDWVIEPLAQAGDHSSNLAHAQKAAFTFGRADDDWRFLFTRSFCHCLQGDKVGDIEVPIATC